MPATADPRERLAMVFGRDAADALIPLDPAAARTLDGSLRGFISAPGSDRADRRMQMLFVNGRLLAQHSAGRRVDRRIRDLRDDRASSVRRAVSRSSARSRRSKRPSDQKRRSVALRHRKSSMRCGARWPRRCRSMRGERFREHVAPAGAGVSLAPPSIDTSLPHVRVALRRASRTANPPWAAPTRCLAGACACSGNSIARTSWQATASRSCWSISTRRTSASPTRPSSSARGEHAPSEPLLVPLIVELTRRRARRSIARSSCCGRRPGDRAVRRTHVIASRATPAGYGARAVRSRRISRRSHRRAEATRRARTRSGRRSRATRSRVAGERLELGRDDDARRPAAAVREPDALPARPSDDGAARARSRSHDMFKRI